MAETRIRGQEVSIRISQGNEVQDTVTAIKDFSAQWDFATISEGYVGETTMRQDDIFNGISGSFTVDHESQDLMLLLDTIRQRAQRRLALASSQINATGRFTFPNGETPLLLIPDMKFDAVPVTIGSRDTYVNSAFPYKAETARVLTT